MNWRVILEQDVETGDWAAWVPELPGCSTAGISEQDALAKIGKAIRLFLRQEPLLLNPGAIVRYVEV
jgi:predicted RNase H-like HicB family nuclease